ncbi:NAD-dependent epimerase/dehydratase family protein [Pseudomonas sp. HMWF006]|uniref:NAD-dependent epimerase/dehydratase family protein n=1 Tax=Pseudomonas sp. HMWF006 TaxID=2056843 RepID=UPI000D403F80|nr:NAD-dependent epimerase/dehydratase family protein [Pseudomonas sp. HMWF006]PTT01268.1 hypothetical protein DBR24_09115 [Pseudomonas sp. HMWF006]PTT60764.1 hypothetical protein DBR26_28380 [Pseudomonas sp. HMWF007]PTT87281.1 hypothetical protein DBR29_20375 [Pseudomonas sp. HMWF005]
MILSRRVLVLGATGGIGGEVARRLRESGWQVCALRRGGRPPHEGAEGFTWFDGDAMNRQQVMAAAQGCSVIVHAVNPPGYRDWDKRVLPMIDNTIAAAIAQGATIVLPGTVYNYGPDAFPLLHEDSPQHPVTRKGALRVELERHLREASTQGCRVIIVRAGNFFGPVPGNNWFSQGLVKPGRAVTRVLVPSAKGIGNQWAYLPDVANTMTQLLERRETLAPFAAFHMDGHWDADGRQMAEAIRRVVARHGGKTPRIKAFPWWLINVLSPFVETFREMQEMRYLWQQPVRLNGAQLQSTLGREPHTPLDEAVEATLVGLGCVDQSYDALSRRRPAARMRS